MTWQPNSEQIRAALPKASLATLRLNGLIDDPVKPSSPTVECAPRMRQNRGPELNKLELAFCDYLRAWSAKDGSRVSPHALTFRIGNGVRYTPDFIVTFTDNTIAAYEVKGPHAWDDSIVKLKVAAAQFPWCAFWLASRDKPTTWRIERVMP